MVKRKEYPSSDYNLIKFTIDMFITDENVETIFNNILREIERRNMQDAKIDYERDYDGDIEFFITGYVEKTEKEKAKYQKQQQRKRESTKIAKLAHKEKVKEAELKELQRLKEKYENK